MLTLCLRSDKLEAELYLYNDKTKIDEITWEAHRKLADTIHLQIEEILIKNGKLVSDIEKIAIYQGPGSFTGLRIGMSVANSLAYANSIPIVAAEGEGWIDECLIKQVAEFMPVHPVYGMDANITEPKK